MKGYIDMIFHSKGCYYLIDWKSNYLGERIENYAKKCLEKIMVDNYYILQYHLYTLALHLYLRFRMPDYNYETDFGGIFYIFIRGINYNHGPKFGIYKDRPSFHLINAMEKALVHFKP